MNLLAPFAIVGAGLCVRPRFERHANAAALAYWPGSVIGGALGRYAAPMFTGSC
jgi:hypothetical protein